MTNPLGLDAFRVALDGVTAKANDAMRRIVRYAAWRVAQNVVVGGEYAPGTPVDTGFARASWWTSLNDLGEPHQPGQNPKPGEPWDGSHDLTALGGFDLGDMLLILSNTEYMRSLEYGHSKKAPHGMIRLTADQWPDIVRESVRAIRRAEREPGEEV